jgi:LysM repeat protein
VSSPWASSGRSLGYSLPMTVAGEDSVEPHVGGIPTGPSERDSSAARSKRPAMEAICPYLVAEAGGWRSVSPHREHRCGAVDPAAPLSADKQRRLCLSLIHQTCPAFVAARAARAAALAPGVNPAVLAAAEAARRPIVRSASLILEQPRLISSARARWPLDRAVSQAALVGLMVVAFALVAIARLAATGQGAPSTSASPVSSAVAVIGGTPSPSPSETAASSASETAAIQSPGPNPSSTPPATSRTTYTVRSGDTLLGIATRYGTTVTAIKKLNRLSNSTLHVGQKLKIP